MVALAAGRCDESDRPQFGSDALVVSDYADNPLVGYSLKYAAFAGAYRSFAAGGVSEKDMLATFAPAREAAERFLKYYEESKRSGGRRERQNKLPFVVELNGALQSTLGDPQRSSSHMARVMADQEKFALSSTEVAAYIHLLQAGAAEELPRILHTGRSPELVPGDNQISIRKSSAVPGSEDEVSGLEFWSRESGNGHFLTSEITTRSSSGREYEIVVKGQYWKKSVRQVSENLLFLRIWWGRHWGGDYIFNADTGAFVYQEGFYEDRGQ